jgi:exosome complex component RRP41
MSLIGDDGLREDGRKPDELRPIKIEAGVLKNADGSAYVEWGKNKVLVAVYGPKEMYNKYLQDPRGAVVQVTYNMAAFSVDDRVRPGPSRRSTEISKIIGEALERVIITEDYRGVGGKCWHQVCGIDSCLGRGGRCRHPDD